MSIRTLRRGDACIAPLVCGSEHRECDASNTLHQPTTVLFFFEVGLFLLILGSIALGEFVSRTLALGLWAGCTTVSLVGYVRVSRSARASDPIDEKWTRTLLYNWRRTNALLVAGLAAVAGWWWLT